MSGKIMLKDKSGFSGDIYENRIRCVWEKLWGNASE